MVKGLEGKTYEGRLKALGLFSQIVRPHRGLQLPPRGERRSSCTLVHLLGSSHTGCPAAPRYQNIATCVLYRRNPNEHSCKSSFIRTYLPQGSSADPWVSRASSTVLRAESFVMLAAAFCVAGH